MRHYATRPIDAGIWGFSKQSLDFRVYVTDHQGRVLFDSENQAVGADYSQWRDVARTLRGDQKVSITYRFRDGFSQPQQELTVRASVDEESGNHNWRTWFYKIVPTHTRVLEVAPDYSWAMLGYPGREMAWIFSRQPDMDKELYKELATRLRDDYGVNTDKLKRVPQQRSQVDKLGYEVPNQR